MNKNDPLKDAAPVELRQMSFKQRDELKRLVEKILDSKVSWSYDQRSVFAEIDTQTPGWRLTDKTGAVTMTAVLQVVMRPHLVGLQARGILLYHRVLRKQKTTTVKTKENDELENDGVVKRLNEKENSGLSTPWVCTKWTNSTWAEKLTELMNIASGGRLKQMQEAEEEEAEPAPRSYRRSPF